MDASTWIVIAKVALWFVAGTAMIATLAILAAGSRKEDSDKNRGDKDAR